MTAEELVQGLEDLHRGQEAQWRLIMLGEQAVEPLRRFLLEPPGLHPQPRMLAAEALGLIGGPQATAALITVLLHGDLASLPPVLRLSEEAVRNRVARELGRLGDPTAVEPLLDALRRFHLVEAGRALAQFRETRALPYLVEALEDPFSRDRVAEAIERFGLTAVEALVQSLGCRRVRAGAELRPSVERRAESARLLGELKDPRAEVPLASCLRDEAREVRICAALALTKLRFRGRLPERAAALIEGLGGPNPSLAEECGEALLAIGEPAVPALVTALSAEADGPDADAQGIPAPALWRMVRVLAGLGERGLAALACLARDPRPVVRWLAVATLGQAEGPLAEPALRAARHDPDPRVRHTARALLTPSDLRHDRTPGVRFAALCGTLRRRLDLVREWVRHA